MSVLSALESGRKKKKSWERKTEPWLSSPALTAPSQLTPSTGGCRIGCPLQPLRAAGNTAPGCKDKPLPPSSCTEPFGAQPPCQIRRGSHTGVRAVTLCSSLMPSHSVPKPSKFLASKTGTVFCWAALILHNTDAPSRDVCYHTMPIFHQGCKLSASRTSPEPAAALLSASDSAMASLRPPRQSRAETQVWGTGIRSRSHGVFAF